MHEYQHNVAKRNEATENTVNCYMRNEELESHAAQINQTGFSGLPRARMVNKGWSLLILFISSKTKSFLVSISIVDLS